jgi:predicted O-methyltransferase YrrM
MSAAAFTPSRFHVVHTAPVWMSMHERVVVYSLVAGLQPKRVLEIGTFRGGSTLIMCAALDDLGSDASITCVDPEPRVDPADWALVEHRAAMVAESSPQGLAKAREIAGAPFDFALIDGDHSQEGVRRDVVGTVPVLADDAHLLFHDALYWRVEEGIAQALTEVEGTFEDAGMVSVQASSTDGGEIEDGHEVRWGGLRLMRFRRS